ncbi:RNA polymerase sigma factor 54 interaction domain protein [Acididesulfobacillus acetoxydans]|uniref:RNA polymerase sigma factor 54 interaction domain protein n=1 Tax=Acididesulfobacillus acetoxydans TaxID=1561005 RepID=A0A8S0W9Y9_9FIRM|nr:sigma 54-interacting transcriptional regulator [Acididesulfobacillus acetoxydans]CAA7602989.1 RNA polymerase sigma factor 54 interaction domain protein [Acididesulfobacillus acetoxydans]CEJ05871.1 Signal-transduction and transcriptional-control protein [Acididesulfobacillus acetoxydans]
MDSLYDIETTVRQTAEAIAAALKIEVEIAGADLTRVAGTGTYSSRCGFQMEDSFVYRHVLESGEPVIIDKPGYDPLCEPCASRGNCLEFAEVAMPIKAEGSIIGVIGLISFDEEQTQRLLENKDSLLRFLDKMAELMAAKAIEHRQNRERELLTGQLLTVLNFLNDGILLTDAERRVTHYNRLAQKLLDIPETEPSTLFQLLDEKRLWRSVERGEVFSGQVKGKRVASQFYCDAVPVANGERIEGAVITLKDVQQIKKLVKAATETEIETHFSEIIAASAKMKRLKEVALKVAPSNATLLIQGESGTGKELLARAIHQSSKRRDNSFITINCGAIPENLLESELFGYDEGAFTGARRGGKLGKFELAHNGTIFLDEIGDMPLHLQVKILRVLQERRVERVGGLHSIPVDVRVIAATNRDLESMVKTGEFREDLFYRLNVIPLYIAPLRERQEDVPLLIRFYLEHYSQVTGKSVRGISPEALRILSRYTWPGNVRELGNVVEYSVTMTPGEYITAEFLPARVLEGPQSGPQPKTSLNLKSLEKEAIIKALTAAEEEGNKEGAAKLLGISRATLYRKIKEYNIREQTVFKV